MKIAIRNYLGMSILGLLFLTGWSCQKEEENSLETEKNAVEKELAAFVVTLASDFPTDEATLKLRIQSYLQNAPSYFYGATISVLDSNGNVSQSPYFFRKGDNTLGFSEGLMSSEYQIDIQEWLRKPIDTGEASWTEPYFDAGGGNIWMQTRSVPVYIRNTIVAVATTDIPVNEP
jgi:sigma-B regulation protein RsbU (phosphoserine phosphatase)